MQMNPSEQFAAHVAEARYEDLPDPIVARAKERLADSVGVMSAGARGVGIPGMVDMAKAWVGAEQASDLQLWRQGARPRGGLRQQPAAALLRFRGHRRRRLPDALACSRDEHDRPRDLGAGLNGRPCPARIFRLLADASRRRHGLPSDRGHAVRPLGTLRRERHGELPRGGCHRVEGLGPGSRADPCSVRHRPQHGRWDHAEHAGLLDLQAGERPVRLPRNLRRRNGPQRLQGPRRPDHGSQVLHGHVRQERRRVRVAQGAGGAGTSSHAVAQAPGLLPREPRGARCRTRMPVWPHPRRQGGQEGALRARPRASRTASSRSAARASATASSTAGSPFPRTS